MMGVMRILIAPSCFKEGLSAEEVARAIDEGLVRALPDSTRRLLPLSDGGEGFTRTLVGATGGRLHPVGVSGPLGTPVEGFLGRLGSPHEEVTVLEIATAAGLRLVPRQQRNPLVATSFGVGELIRAALDTGARRLLIGCGDSGTVDGGYGLARALGVRFLDESGSELPPTVDALERLHAIDRTGLDSRLADTSIEVACSMFTTLVGPRGTAGLFAPQKGADSGMVGLIERSLGRLASVLSRETGLDVGSIRGGGAAGGMGVMFHALLGAKLSWRYDVVFRFLPFEERLAESDLLITGEGMFDGQSPRDKIPCEVARRAEARGIPTVVLAGAIGPGVESTNSCSVDAYVGITGGVRPLEVAMAEARPRLVEAAFEVGRALRLGARLAGRDAELALPG